MSVENRGERRRDREAGREGAEAAGLAGIRGLILNMIFRDPTPQPADYRHRFTLLFVPQ